SALGRGTRTTDDCRIGGLIMLPSESGASGRVRFQADANFSRWIIKGLLWRHPTMDMQTAEAAGLRGLSDPEVLARAADEGRALLSHDYHTMPTHFGEFLASGKHSAGVFLLHQTLPLADTPHGLQPGGFSGRPRSYRRESPQALPAPWDSSGRVLVAVEHQPTGGTDRGTHAQAPRAARAPAAPGGAGGGRFYHHDSLHGACCLVGEDRAELRPAGIAAARAEASSPDPVGDPQVFQLAGVVLAQQGQRGLVVQVAPL